MRHDASGVKLQLMAESVASLRIAVAGDVMVGRTIPKSAAWLFAKHAKSTPPSEASRAS